MYLKNILFAIRYTRKTQMNLETALIMSEANHRLAGKMLVKLHDKLSKIDTTATKKCHGKCCTVH